MTSIPAPAGGLDLPTYVGPVIGFRLLAGRQILRTIRQPFVLVPALMIPVFFLLVITGALTESMTNAGIESAANFVLPVSVLFMLASGGAGLSMVADIESGHFDKLLMAPVPRVVILLGSMAGDFVLFLAQIVLLLVLSLAFGVSFGMGIGGAVLLILLAGLWGIAYAAIGYGVALSTGSSEATNGAFALFFPFMFLTTTFQPLDALQDWLRIAARANPVTYVLEATRMLLSEEFSATILAQGFLAAGLTMVLTLGWATFALMKRTH